MSECNTGKNMQNCNCSYDPCPRKGKCCDCIMYHKRSGQVPACFFSSGAEKTYDRSVENFISDYKKTGAGF